MLTPIKDVLGSIVAHHNKRYHMQNRDEKCREVQDLIDKLELQVTTMLDGRSVSRSADSHLRARFSLLRDAASELGAQSEEEEG